jgi:hypothetical protein
MVASIKHIFIFSGGHSARHFLHRSIFLDSKLKRYEEIISDADPILMGTLLSRSDLDRNLERDTVDIQWILLYHPDRQDRRSS